jgi:type IV pilus assembly protein PilF
MIRITYDLERARIALEAGNTEVGLRELGTILEADPTNIEANRLLARHHAAVGSPVLAEQHLRTILSRRPTYPAAQAMLGGMLFQQQRFHEALAEYREAVKQTPEDPRVPGWRQSVERVTQELERQETPR